MEHISSMLRWTASYLLQYQNFFALKDGISLLKNQTSTQS